METHEHYFTEEELETYEYDDLVNAVLLVQAKLRVEREKRNRMKKEIEEYRKIFESIGNYSRLVNKKATV